MPKKTNPYHTKSKVPPHIECPYCHKEGHTYLEEGRWYFKCDGLCQMVKLLKLLNMKMYA